MRARGDRPTIAARGLSASTYWSAHWSSETTRGAAAAGPDRRARTRAVAAARMRQGGDEPEEQAVDAAPRSGSSAGAQAKFGLVIISATRPWQAAHSAWARPPDRCRRAGALGGDLAHHAANSARSTAAPSARVASCLAMEALSGEEQKISR